MAKLVGVPAAAVSGLWEHIAPLVLHCLDKSREHRYGTDDVLQMLAANDLQLWLVVEDKAIQCIVLTQIHIYPQAKEAVLFMVSGEYPKNWSEITHQLLAWAQSLGCSHFSAYMRRGLLKRMGWDERQTYCVRGVNR